jgi:hypothetical protein
MSVVLEAFASAIDHNGSLVTAELAFHWYAWLWHQLATLLGPVSAASTTKTAVFSMRTWWLRTYFAVTAFGNSSGTATRMEHILDWCVCFSRYSEIRGCFIIVIRSCIIIEYIIY